MRQAHSTAEQAGRENLCILREIVDRCQLRAVAEYARANSTIFKLRTKARRTFECCRSDFGGIERERVDGTDSCRNSHARYLGLLHRVAANRCDTAVDRVSIMPLGEREKAQCNTGLTVLRVIFIQYIIFCIECTVRQIACLNRGQVSAHDKRICTDALYAVWNCNAADAGAAECVRTNIGHIAACGKFNSGDVRRAIVADSIAFGCVCIQDFRQLQTPRGSVAAIICHRTFAGNGQGVGLHLIAAVVGVIVEAPGCVMCHTVQGIVIRCQIPRDIITLRAASAGCFSRIG